MKNYDYMLRYCMEPHFCEQERLENLLAFCRKTRTADVMFFYNCEELNRGHYTPDELDLWLDLIARMKPILAADGITTSINPWATILHCDRGRQLRPGQDFAVMVDPFGNQATAVACPAGDRFLDFLAYEFRTCAERVQPHVLWVEDDFRLHNHSPLNWGGCFCEKHMALYAEAAGKVLTREEFVQGVLESGRVHPYRKIWLDTALTTMRRMAQTIRDAVMPVSPQTRLGLMTSDPVAHCAEGRDWDEIFTALRTAKNPYIRIHLPSYQETTTQNYGIAFANVSRLTRHMAPDWVANYGELENFTFSRFSKSLSFTQMQLETNVLLDGKGITLDIYDMMGNGILPGEGYQDILAQSKPFLDTLVNLGFDNKHQEGVHVLVDPRCAYHLKTSEGRAMTELYAHERNLMQMLIPFGLSTCYSSEHDLQGKVVAVSGQYLRNLSAKEIYALFTRNFVILDGEGVRTLADLELGELAGLGDVRLVPMHNGVNAFEQVVDGVAYCGISHARMTLQAGAGDFVQVSYRPDVILHAFTHAFSPYNEDNGPAMTLVNDHILVLPYENYGPAILNPFRRSIMLHALEHAQAVQRPIWTDTPHTSVIWYRLPDRTLLALVNYSGDTWSRPIITVPDGLTSWSAAALYTRDYPQGIPAPLMMNGHDLVIEQALPRAQMMVLELTHSDISAN